MGPSELRVVAVLASMAGVSLAGFITPFTEVEHGQRLEVSWERLAAEDLPVYILGKVFNATDSGVNMFQTNISTDLTDSAFMWTNIPYPLPYIPGAQYELEVISQKPSDGIDDDDDESAPTLAKTDLFTIGRGGDSSSDGRRPTFDPLGQPEQSEEPHVGPSTVVIVAAVCVSLGIPILIAIGFWFWCMRRQRKRLQYEETRRRRYDTIIE